MTKILAISVVVIASVFVALLQAEEQRRNEVKTNVKEFLTLTQMEDDWGQAVLKKDAVALGKILADDWVGQYPFYTINKAEELAYISSGEIKVESTNTSAMNVRVFGNAAVVTGTDVEKGTFKGKDTSGRYLWTDVFIKRHGHWQVVASQETLMPPS
jgi:ketosteroid isomerase-like protein